MSTFVFWRYISFVFYPNELNFFSKHSPLKALQNTVENNLHHVIQSISPRRTTFEDNLLTNLSNRSFHLDDESIFRRGLIPINSIIQIESSKGFKSGLFGGQWMMESCLCTMRHCAILLKCPIGSQDVVSVFESHWKYFSNVSGMIDCSFIKNDTPLEHTASLPQEIFVFALRHPFYQLRLDWLPIYDHFGSCRSHLCRNNFSSENRIFIVFSFRKRVRTQFENFFLFSLCSSISGGSTVGRRSRSFFNIRRTLVREIFSSTANFRLVTFFFWFDASLF